jgi:hypothetical protein
MIARNPAIWAGALDGDPASKGGRGEGRVDAGRYACGGDHRSAFHHPLPGVAGTAALQLFGACPVSAGILPVEDSGGRQVDRTGAHTGRPGSGGVDLTQPVHHLLVRILIRQAAADDHHIGRCQLREGGRCDQLAAACAVDDRPGLSGPEHGVMARYTGEHRSASACT